MGMRDRNVRKGIEVYENGDDSYLYLPGQLLVDSANEERARSVLDGDIRGQRQLDDRLNVTHLEVVGDVHAKVELLRKEGVRCGPNHVITGEPRYIGGPATVVEPSEYGLSDPAGDEGAGVTVVVLDTGYTCELHPWLDQRVDSGGAPNEPLDTHTPDGSLDHEAGHGTFIAGVIADIAPGARIIVRRVLESDGFGDEATIAQVITEVCALKPDILNLSLGAYTHGNLPPVGLANALRQVPRTSVVVAAAGNAGRDVPFWPAALKQVWSVAAVDGDDQRACFSNFGHWVDCAARGVDIRSCFPIWDGNDPGPFSNGWATWSGTSFAAPRMAGLVAREMTDGGGPAAEAVHRVLARASRIDPLVGAVIA
jgi:subtilisin family serine protease